MELNLAYDSAVALSHWSASPKNKEVLGSRAESVAKKIRNGIMRLDQLRNAAEQNACFGIFGPSQAGKSYLTAKLAEDSSGVLRVSLGTPHNFLKDINPEGGKESTALVTRFSSKAVSAEPDFPIRATLLSEIDIVCILVNSYFLDNEEVILPTTEDIKLSIESINTASGSSSVKGVSLEEIYYLENYLDKRVFDSSAKDLFNPVWVWFSQNFNQLSQSARKQAYSLLWNNNASFDKLFDLLVIALNKLDGERALDLPLEALLPRSQSIIDVQILKNIETQEDEDEIKVSGVASRKAFQIKKSTLSALVQELKMQILEPANKSLQQADFLDFPGARTRFASNIASETQAGSLNKISEYFLRGKIAYLFQKYSESFLIDGLILCVRPDPMEVKELPQIISNWVDLNHTVDEQSGFRDDPRLFFCLTQFDKHLPDNAGRSGDDSVRFSNALEAGLIEPFGKRQNSWVSHWSNGPFNNVFPIRNPNHPVDGFFIYENGIEKSVTDEKKNRLIELGKGFSGSKNVQKYLDAPNEKWAHLISPGDGGVFGLIDAISTIDLPNLKSKNLLRQFRATLREMVELVSSFEVSDDRDTQHQKELERFANYWPEYNSIFESGRFSQLIKFMQISEERALSAMMTRPKGLEITKTSQPEKKRGQFVPTAIKSILVSPTESLEVDNNTLRLSRSEYFSDAILRSWISNTAQKLDALEVRKHLKCNVEAIEFLIGHLTHSKQVTQLSDLIKQRVEEWDSGQTWSDNIMMFAKISCDLINGYVYRCKILKDDGEIEVVVPAEVFEFNKKDLNNETVQWEYWATNFAQMIEDNIKGHQSLVHDQEENEKLKIAISTLAQLAA